MTDEITQRIERLTRLAHLGALHPADAAELGCLRAMVAIERAKAEVRMAEIARRATQGITYGNGSDRA